jgi:hypothetical protein
MKSEGSLHHSQDLFSFPYSESDQSSPHHLILALTLSTHLHLVTPSALLPYDFLINNLCTFFFSHIRANYSAHLISLYFIFPVILAEEYKSRILLFMLFSPPTLHIIPLQSKYSHQQPVSKHPHYIFLH